MTVFTVHVYCGNYVGEPHWHGTESYEPDECNAELDVEIEAEIELEHVRMPGMRSDEHSARSLVSMWGQR